MGSRICKLSNKEMKLLMDSTHLKKKELQKWYKDFMKDCPSGKLTKRIFEDIYRQLFPFGNPSKFASFVFKVVDQNADGFISFTEFITAVTTAANGTVDAKLEWAFSIYDLDNDGYITREEMFQIVDSIYTMAGEMVGLPEEESTPEKRVDIIFAKMDENHDEKLTLDEFKEGANCDPWIIHALNISF